MIKFYLSVIGTLLLLSSGIAQTVNDYRSRNTGPWNDANSWERYNGTTWQTSTNVPDNNSGIITILNSDTITITSATNADQLTVDPGGTLRINNPLTLADGPGTDLTINGILDFTLGNISGAGKIISNNIFNWSGGIVYCETTIAATGVLNYNATADCSANAKFINNGTVNWTAGRFNIENSLFTNNGQFFIAGPGADLQSSGTGSFLNSQSGTLTKTAANLVNISIDFTNRGTIDISEGVLRHYQKNFMSAGKINIGAGKTFQNTSVMNIGLGTDYTGNGTLQLTGSELINDAAMIPSSVITLFDGGEITGNAVLTFAGRVEWTTGTLSCLTTIASTGVVNYMPTNVCKVNADIINNGTVNWKSGDFLINNSIFRNNATFNMSGTVDDLKLTGNGSFENNMPGTVRKSSANLMNIDIDFSNDGLVTVEDGKLRNTGSNFKSAGTIQINPGKTFQNTSVLNVNSGTVITGTGTLQLTASAIINNPISISSSVITLLDGGEITGPGPLNFDGVLTFNTGVLSCVTTISPTGVVNFNPTNIISINANVTNNGTVNWNNGDFPIKNSVFTNNASFIIAGPGNMVNGGAASFINNAGGSIDKTSNSFIVCYVPFTNTGLINGLGVIHYNDRFSNNGTIAPGSEKASAIASSLGTFRINGTDNPLTNASSLNIEILNDVGPGVGFDQFQRAGNLELSGALRVSEKEPVLSGTFPIISVSSGVITGDFTSIDLPAGYRLERTSTAVSVTKGGTLPFKLVELKATQSTNAVNINWSTLYEMNTAFFNVEHSANAVNFTSIGKVIAKGKSLVPNDYFFQHKNAVTGSNFYRLEAYDNAGIITYSSIVKIKTGSKVQASVYPNPTRGIFMISGMFSDQTNELKIIDQSGKTIRQHKVNGTSLMMDLSNYASGTYYILVNGKLLKLNKH